MKRRHFILGAGALALGATWLKKPRDEGAPYDEYFAALNTELKANGPMRPCMVIDLDRLDHNIDAVMASVRAAKKQYRVVEKSLPSAKLIDYVFKRSGTRRLMSFHQPFLNNDAEAFPDADILIGKPLPARDAANFYRDLRGNFDPAKQLQWLIDTPDRLAEYLPIAQGLKTRMNLSIEIDVGLHRGGVVDLGTLDAMLKLIAGHPDQLRFAGFMGYDPHVVKMPSALGSPADFLARSLAAYQANVDHLRSTYPQLWRDDLTLNGAGSPTYRLHEAENLTNDLSVGSGLVKPTDFDVPTLAEHQPAAFIATPVLKAHDGLLLPGLEKGGSKPLAWWDPNQRRTYFIYGGNWMARYESPHGLQRNEIFGHSSNQEMANGSPRTALAVNDQVFLRPTQSEFVFLQFGDLVAVRGGRIQEYWPVYRPA